MTDILLKELKCDIRKRIDQFFDLCDRMLPHNRNKNPISEKTQKLITKELKEAQKLLESYTCV